MYMYLLQETNLIKDESLLYGCLPRSSQCNILDESKGAHETLEFRPKFQRMIHHYQGEIEFYSKKVGYQNTCSSCLLYKNKVGKGLTNHSCKRLQNYLHFRFRYFWLHSNILTEMSFRKTFSYLQSRCNYSYDCYKRNIRTFWIRRGYVRLKQSPPPPITNLLF